MYALHRYRYSNWTAYRCAYAIQSFLGPGDHPVTSRMEIVFGHVPAFIWFAIQSYLCYLVFKRMSRRHRHIMWLEEARRRNDLLPRAIWDEHAGEWNARIAQQRPPAAPLHPMFEVKKHKIEARTFVGSTDLDPKSKVTDRDMCSVCWGEFAVGDMYLEMPCEQKHRFHQECIEEWWKRKLQCLACMKGLEWRLAVKE
jgi:hypothetical protein